jgi:hypothetical protein
VGLGASLNEVCRQLVGDDFTEDEEKWKNEKRCNAPFLVVAFGPTKEYTCLTTHFKEHEGNIETYDGFREAKEDLRRQSDAVVSSLLTSFNLSFSSAEQLVCIAPIDSAISGRSLDGRRINDWSFKLRSEACVSKRMDNVAVMEKMNFAIHNSKCFGGEVASFFYRGSLEKDPLKRFLYFFFCVERLVQSTFSDIDHPAAVSSLLSGHARMEVSGQKLLAEHRYSWKELTNRFIWCAMQKWTHLLDADVKKFEELKSIRDKLSHGTLSEPPNGAVTGIEVLALRILSDR